jgi:hypothetical protein
MEELREKIERNKDRDKENTLVSLLIKTLILSDLGSIFLAHLTLIAFL